MTTYTPTGPFVTGGAPGIDHGFLNNVENQLLQAVTSDGTYGDNFLQVGSGNAANKPLLFIVVGPDSSHLPAAGHKGRIAIVVPFSLP
jgi:hypothetical protein